MRKQPVTALRCARTKVKLLPAVFIGREPDSEMEHCGIERTAESLPQVPLPHCNQRSAIAVPSVKCQAPSHHNPKKKNWSPTHAPHTKNPDYQRNDSLPYIRRADHPDRLDHLRMDAPYRNQLPDIHDSRLGCSGSLCIHHQQAIRIRKQGPEPKDPLERDSILHSMPGSHRTVHPGCDDSHGRRHRDHPRYDLQDHSIRNIVDLKLYPKQAVHLHKSNTKATQKQHKEQ